MRVNYYTQGHRHQDKGGVMNQERRHYNKTFNLRAEVPSSLGAVQSYSM